MLRAILWAKGPTQKVGCWGSAKALFSLGAARSTQACTLIGRNRLAAYRRWTGSGAGRTEARLSDLFKNPSASESVSFERLAQYTTTSSPRPIPVHQPLRRNIGGR
jgi:hypothetical protein